MAEKTKFKHLQRIEILVWNELEEGYRVGEHTEITEIKVLGDDVVYCTPRGFIYSADEIRAI